MFDSREERSKGLETTNFSKICLSRSRSRSPSSTLEPSAPSRPPAGRSSRALDPSTFHPVGPRSLSLVPPRTLCEVDPNVVLQARCQLELMERLRRRRKNVGGAAKSPALSPNATNSVSKGLGCLATVAQLVIHDPLSKASKQVSFSRTAYPSHSLFDVNSLERHDTREFTMFDLTLSQRRSISTASSHRSREAILTPPIIRTSPIMQSSSMNRFPTMLGSDSVASSSQGPPLIFEESWNPVIKDNKKSRRRSRKRTHARRAEYYTPRVLPPFSSERWEERLAWVYHEIKHESSPSKELHGGVQEQSPRSNPLRRKIEGPLRKLRISRTRSRANPFRRFRSHSRSSSRGSEAHSSSRTNTPFVPSVMVAGPVPKGICALVMNRFRHSNLSSEEGKAAATTSTAPAASSGVVWSAMWKNPSFPGDEEPLGYSNSTPSFSLQLSHGESILHSTEPSSHPPTIFSEHVVTPSGGTTTASSFLPETILPMSELHVVNDTEMGSRADCYASLGPAPSPPKPPALQERVASAAIYRHPLATLGIGFFCDGPLHLLLPQIRLAGGSSFPPSSSPHESQLSAAGEMLLKASKDGLVDLVLPKDDSEEDGSAATGTSSHPVTLSPVDIAGRILRIGVEGMQGEGTRFMSYHPSEEVNPAAGEDSSSFVMLLRPLMELSGPLERASLPQAYPSTQPPSPLLDTFWAKQFKLSPPLSVAAPSPGGAASAEDMRGNPWGAFVTNSWERYDASSRTDLTEFMATSGAARGAGDDPSVRSCATGGSGVHGRSQGEADDFPPPGGSTPTAVTLPGPFLLPVTSSTLTTAAPSHSPPDRPMVAEVLPQMRNDPVDDPSTALMEDDAKELGSGAAAAAAGVASGIDFSALPPPPQWPSAPARYTAEPGESSTSIEIGPLSVTLSASKHRSLEASNWSGASVPYTQDSPASSSFLAHLGGGSRATTSPVTLAESGTPLPTKPITPGPAPFSFWKRWSATTALYLALGQAGAVDVEYLPFLFIGRATWGELIRTMSPDCAATVNSTYGMPAGEQGEPRGARSSCMDVDVPILVTREMKVKGVLKKFSVNTAAFRRASSMGNSPYSKSLTGVVGASGGSIPMSPVGSETGGGGGSPSRLYRRKSTPLAANSLMSKKLRVVACVAEARRQENPSGSDDPKISTASSPPPSSELMNVIPSPLGAAGRLSFTPASPLAAEQHLFVEPTPFSDPEIFQLYYLQLVFRAFLDIRLPQLRLKQVGESAVGLLRSDKVGVRRSTGRGLIFVAPHLPIAATAESVVSSPNCLYFPPGTPLIYFLELDAVVPLYATKAEIEATNVMPLFGSYHRTHAGSSRRQSKSSPGSSKRQSKSSAGSSPLYPSPPGSPAASESASFRSQLKGTGPLFDPLQRWASQKTTASPCDAMEALKELFTLALPHYGANLADLLAQRPADQGPLPAPRIFFCDEAHTYQSLLAHTPALRRFVISPEARTCKGDKRVLFPTEPRNPFMSYRIPKSEASIFLKDTSVRHSGSSRPLFDVEFQPTSDSVEIAQTPRESNYYSEIQLLPQPLITSPLPLVAQGRDWHNLLLHRTLNQMEASQSVLHSCTSSYIAPVTSTGVFKPRSSRVSVHESPEETLPPPGAALPEVLSSILSECSISTQAPEEERRGTSKPMAPGTHSSSAFLLTEMKNALEKSVTLTEKFKWYASTGDLSLFRGSTSSFRLMSTNNDGSPLGEGGSSVVYKGLYGPKLLPVAVKIFTVPDNMTPQEYVRESLTDVAFYVLLNQLQDAGVLFISRGHDFIISDVLPEGLDPAFALRRLQRSHGEGASLCYFITDLMDTTLGSFLTADHPDFDPWYDTLVNHPLSSAELFQLLYMQLVLQVVFNWKILDLMLNGQLRGDNIGIRLVDHPPSQQARMERDDEEGEASLNTPDPTLVTPPKAKSSCRGLIVGYHFNEDAPTSFLRFPAVSDDSGNILPFRLIQFMDLGQGVQPEVERLTEKGFIGQTTVPSCMKDDGMGRYWPFDELYCRGLDVVEHSGDERDNALIQEVKAWGSGIRLRSREDGVTALKELFELYQPLFGMENPPTEEETKTHVLLMWGPEREENIRRNYVYASLLPDK